VNNPPHILLGHLASFGDCLYATAIARQIKQDYPGCKLTWAIGTIYRPAIEENPYVDEIWEIPLLKRSDMDSVWIKFAKEIKQRKKRGDFDKIFLTQIGPNNYQNFDGTVRSSIFRAYPAPITVPVQPVIRLRQDEVDGVRQFAERYHLLQQKHVILFECSSQSGQSFLTSSYAIEVSKRILRDIPDTAVILSSFQKIVSDDSRIIDGSDLSLRQNAEMTKYCDLFVGCSSGISWLCTSDWAKPLPMIQVINRSMSVFASMYHDAEYFGLPTDRIIEMTDSSEERLAECITMSLSGSFHNAQEKYHERIPVELNKYIETFMRSVLRKGQIFKIIKSFLHVYERYGIDPFIRYLESKMPDFKKL